MKETPQLSKDPFERYLQLKNDPWLFITTCVRTKDQIDRKEPIKLFPNKEYLRLFARLWSRYPLMLVPKTRRMTMSWMTISLFTHEFIFNKAIHTAFVSKKEDDADELVSRAEFILENLDFDIFPKELLPRYKKTHCMLKSDDTDSKIEGFPMGADQLRQFTFSGIFGDESAFWEGAKEFYAATFPTIEGGGRMTLVSSPAPGFFKKLVFDQLDAQGDINVEDYAPDAKTPMEGVRVWTNAKNKFMVYELHYTADPTKRNPEFKESIRNSMPLQLYLREYELQWDTFEGFPVYPEFQKLHITDVKPKPILGLPMLIGFDFGLTPAAVIGQYQGNKLIIFEEYIEINMGMERFSEMIIPELRMKYPAHSNFKKDWLCFIDPSGVFRSDTDENSTALILASKGFVPFPGPVVWNERRTAVVHYLQLLTPDGPAFQIFRGGCPMSIKGFEGGYKYSENIIEKEVAKLRPLKDAYSHPHDAIQYLCSGIKSRVESVKRQIPRAAYSMTQENQNVRKFS